MAYLALARKWRPKTFSEVVGQEHVVKALSNALDSGRVHHAFLFTGTRGVGKTTLARIFAKSLNCEQGASAEPCQQCATCVAVDEGRYVDLIEVDAASRTKVDDTRELLENVQYAPTVGKYKVYLIDEVHMLSVSSFNALLKTLEEPPEHVKFLFATTDPQKLPITVLSRCLQFNLRALRVEQISNQLLKIINNENIAFDQPALEVIAKAADGSMRDGLSLMDQAIAQGAGEVRASEVNDMLGVIKQQHTQAILNALLQQDANQAMQVVADMADDAVDFVVALDQVMMHLYHISLAQVAPQALSDSIDIDRDLINDLAGKLDPETVQLYYQTGLISKRDISLAPSLRVGFEMMLLRMLAFSSTPVSQTQTTPAPAATNKESAVNKESAAIQQQTPVQPLVQEMFVEESPVEEKQAPPAATAQATSQENRFEQSPAGENLPTNNSPSLLAGHNEWGALVEQLPLSDLSKELAMNCACEKMNDDQVQLSLTPTLGILLNNERRQQIQSALEAHAQCDLTVQIEIQKSDRETPAECLKRLGQEDQQALEDIMRNDQGVQALSSTFDAQIVDNSIKPIE